MADFQIQEFRYRSAVHSFIHLSLYSHTMVDFRFSSDLARIYSHTNPKVHFRSSLFLI